MRRAALYCWNRGCLVVVDEGPEGPIVVDSIDFEAATASPEWLAAVVTCGGVDRLLVTAAPEGRPFPEAAQHIADEVSHLVAVECRLVPDAERRKYRGAAAKLVPKGAGSEAMRDAMTLVLADGAPAKDEGPGLLWAPSALIGGIEPQAPQGPTSLHRAPQPMGSSAHEEPTPATTAPQGPRVAGVDPGERWIAVCVGALTGDPAAPLAYVASLQVEIERTGKDQPTDEQLDAAVGKAVDFCELHGVERAVVERAVNVHRAPGKSAEEGAGLAAYLLRGQYVAGMLRGALRAARREGGGPLIPGRVESVSSVKGRNHVRRLDGLAAVKGVAWQPSAHRAFGGTIPAGVGEHVLDAAVCAVWATRPEEGAKGEATPRAPRELGKGRPSGAAREKAKRDAARREAGCVCPGARHEKGCPIAVAANAKRAAAMAGNGNARKGGAG